MGVMHVWAVDYGYSVSSVLGAHCVLHGYSVSSVLDAQHVLHA